MGKRRSGKDKLAVDEKHFRSLLEARLQSLEKNGSREIADMGSDPSDNAREFLASETSGRTEGIVSRARKEIQAALERLAVGEYGICQECGERIPPKRLQAVPEAACCVACVEACNMEKEARAIA